MARRHTKLVSKKDRQRLLDEVNGKCAYCGIELNGVFEVDHVIPVRKGGKDCYDNYLASCAKCNVRKSTLLIEQFRKALLNNHNQMIRDSAKYRNLMRFGIIEKKLSDLVFHFEEIGITFKATKNE